MTVRSQLRTLLLCIPLAMGSLMGVSMRAEELEELMSFANRPKIAFSIGRTPSVLRECQVCVTIDESRHYHAPSRIDFYGMACAGHILDSPGGTHFLNNPVMDQYSSITD